MPRRIALLLLCLPAWLLAQPPVESDGAPPVEEKTVSPATAEPSATDAPDDPALETPPPPHHYDWDDWVHDTQMTGAWGGARTALEDRGLKFDLFYNTTTGINLHGGADVNDAHRNSGSFDLFVRAEFDRLGFDLGGQALMQVKSRYSRNVNLKVGALSEPFDDADGDRDIYIAQLWYQRAFLGNTLRLRLGYLDWGVIADRNAYAGFEDRQFMATYLDNNGLVPLKIGLGVAVFYDPTEWLGFIIGAADRDGATGRTGFDTAFHGSDRFVGYFETQLRLRPEGPRGVLPGNYRVGVFYDPTSRERFGTGGPDVPPLREADDVGFYLSFDQLLLRESDKDEQGLGAFFRFGYRRGEVNRLDRFWSGGLQYAGLLPGRDLDVLGLGMYWVGFADEYRMADHRDFVREVGYELYYLVQVTPWLELSPDVQYIVHPGGSKASRDATIVGLRARLSF